MKVVLSRVATGLAWTSMLVALAYFFVRDVPHYANVTPESYGPYWDVIRTLQLHVIGAAVAILVGCLQFCAPLRRRLATLHRRLGYAYVAGCLIGAPAALGLALHSDCPVCRPSLAILSVYWFATTLSALALARRRELVRHREFMIRSFVAMNVFVLVRIGYKTPVPGLSEIEHRMLMEWICVTVPLLLVEIFLSWAPSIRLLLRKSVPSIRRSA